MAEASNRIDGERGLAGTASADVVATSAAVEHAATSAATTDTAAAATNISFRFATESDAALILHFIRGLADYERMSDEVVATEEILREWIFRKGKAEVLFVLDDGVEVGFALFFCNFSTFLGRAGLYLEDLFVEPAARGRGIGGALMRELARIAVERGYGRFEWCCLDWNQPSIDFYLSLGATQMGEWSTYRLTGDALLALAGR